MSFGRFDQAVQIGTGDDTVDRLRKDPVFAADDKGPDRILRPVVVDGAMTIVNITDEPRPLMVQVTHRLTQLATRQYRRQRLIQPPPQLL